MYNAFVAYGYNIEKSYLKVAYTNTPSVPISKHQFDFIFVLKCKPLFKLLDVFIIFFPKHTPN